MAHLRSQATGGYYPFPPEHLPALASLIKATAEGGRILDPCAGEGNALKRLAEAWNLTPYANELDAGRTAACREKFGTERSAQGDLMTLRTPNGTYSIVYINPPYAENSGGADEKRREFEHLAHAWKWVQDGGFVIWVVYAQHMTERAASFLAKHSSNVDVYRVPGLHLGTYPQIVVVAKARPEMRGETADAETLHLIEACKSPDSLPPLEVCAEPVYRLPAPAHVKRFYFHPDEVTAELMLPALAEHGVQRTNTFQAIVETPPPPPELAPIVPPRGGQLGLILAAGLFNGLLLNLEEGPAAVRGVVRMTEINTTPPEMVGVRETIEHKAQVTISLLHKSGKVTVIESHEKDRLVAFLKAHKQAFLDYLSEHSKPLYDFDYARYSSIFDRVFRNRVLPGRPVTGLFETQKHVTAAMLAALEKRRKVLLVGDMGVGVR
jgi:16S rRNA G966 N2-methylase RsmD